ASGGWKEILPGLASGTAKAEGFWEAGDPGAVDDAMWTTLGGASAWSVYPSANQTYAQSADYGSTAYIINALNAQYKLGGALGDVAGWSADVDSTWPVVRGVS